MQELRLLVSPCLWNRMLTLNLSWPPSSLSLSTCSERREADRGGERGSTVSDRSCEKMQRCRWLAQMLVSNQEMVSLSFSSYLSN